MNLRCEARKLQKFIAKVDVAIKVALLLNALAISQ